MQLCCNMGRWAGRQVRTGLYSQFQYQWGPEFSSPSHTRSWWCRRANQCKAPPGQEVKCTHTHTCRPRISGICVGKSQCLPSAGFEVGDKCLICTRTEWIVGKFPAESSPSCAIFLDDRRDSTICWSSDEELQAPQTHNRHTPAKMGEERKPSRDSSHLFSLSVTSAFFPSLLLLILCFSSSPFFFSVCPSSPRSLSLLFYQWMSYSPSSLLMTCLLTDT